MAFFTQWEWVLVRERRKERGGGAAAAIRRRFGDREGGASRWVPLCVCYVFVHESCWCIYAWVCESLVVVVFYTQWVCWCMQETWEGLLEPRIAIIYQAVEKDLDFVHFLTII